MTEPTPASAPQPQPQPKAQEAPAPAPAPYGFAGLAEATLTAPLRPWALFEAAAARPEPSLGALLGNLAVYAAAFLAINFVRASIAFPTTATAYPPVFVALVGAGALTALLVALAVAAAPLHTVARLCGGEGSFRRSLQAVSMSAAVLPLTSLISFAGPLAPLVAVPLWALMTAAAFEKLHRAPAAAARTACAVLAAVALGLGWLVAAAAARAAAPYLELSRSLRQLEARGAFPAAPAPDLAAPQAPAGTAAPGASGLDLLSSPAPLDPARIEEMQRAGQQAARAGADAMGSVLPALQQAQSSPDLSSDQKKQLGELTGMLQQLQGQMQGGQGMTPQQQQEFMRKIQEQMRRASQAPPSGAEKK